jgi:hypothetical protein
MEHCELPGGVLELTQHQEVVNNTNHDEVAVQNYSHQAPNLPIYKTFSIWDRKMRKM